MPVALTCSCGKQLRVADGLAGRRVKCPACGEGVAIPAVAATPRPASPKAAPAQAPAKLAQTPADGVIRFRCACGKDMQARAVHAGKSTRCPACKELVKIPAGVEDEAEEEESHVQADRPARKASTRREEMKTTARRRGKSIPDEDEDEDREDEEQGSRRRGGPRKRSTWLWVGVAAGVLLLVGGIGAWLLFSGPSMTPDLALVPGNAQGFVTIRVADFWNSDLAKQALAQIKQKSPQMPDLNAEIEKDFGFVPADVERLTLVADNVQNGSVWGIVSTYKPYDKAKILGKLSGAQERKQGSKAYQVASKGGEQVAVYFHNERIFLVGPEKGIQRSLTLMEGKRASGPLDSILKKASGKHLVVGGAANQPEVAALKSMMTGSAAPYAGLLDFQSISLQIDLAKGNTAEVEVGLSFPDSDKAKGAKQVIDASLAQAKMMLPLLAKGMGGMKDVPVDQMATKALESLKVNQSGSETTLTASLPVGDPAALVEVLVGSKSSTVKSAGPGDPGKRPDRSDKRPDRPDTRPVRPNPKPGRF